MASYLDAGPFSYSADGAALMPFVIGMDGAALRAAGRTVRRVSAAFSSGTILISAEWVSLRAVIGPRASIPVAHCKNVALDSAS